MYVCMYVSILSAHKYLSSLSLDWIDTMFTKNHSKIIFIFDVLIWISLNKICPYYAAHWVIFSNWILRHYHSLRLKFQQSKLEVIQNKTTEGYYLYLVDKCRNGDLVRKLPDDFWFFFATKVTEILLNSWGQQTCSLFRFFNYFGWRQSWSRHDWWINLYQCLFFLACFAEFMGGQLSHCGDQIPQIRPRVWSGTHIWMILIQILSILLEWWSWDMLNRYK